jgi:SAM-dependent methyltransferase
MDRPGPSSENKQDAESGAYEMSRDLRMRSTQAEHRAYFQGQLDSNVEFWRRFGRRPNLAGASVLDLGCGHGAMSIEVARAGATVLGVDLDRDRIDFARHNAELHHRDLLQHIDFQTVDLTSEADGALAGSYDVVLSKDTFEHVVDVRAMLSAIGGLLRPGGELWAGFSPLYWSPKGDHGRTGLRLPWAHAILPRAVVMKAASRHTGRPIATLSDLSLNGITSSEFFEYAQDAGFEVDSVLFNGGEKRFMGAFRKARRAAFLERYFTVSIYSVLRNTAPVASDSAAGDGT